MEEKSNVKLYAGIGCALMAFLMMTVAMVVVAVAGTVYYMQTRGVVPRPAPTPVVVTQGVGDILAGNPEDARKVAGVFGALANLVEKDTEIVTSTADIRQANSIAGRLAYGVELKGKYPGLAEAIDRKLVDAIGRQRRELTPEARSLAAKALRSVSEEAASVR